jgi:hypothetical protein
MEKESESEWYNALKKKYANMPEEIRDYWNKRIDEEYKRRNIKNSLADDPKDYAKGRHLGTQDIGDISYKVPWQKVVRDQLGLTIPINTNYKCPVCGKVYGLEFPPERCMACGCRSFLHMRKLVNLKY